ncbi:hypothetical protein [Streptomyces sp. NPDC045470]|uniref:hypothetical protein n=1 Tax=Streptomyces sp. NPDC045470 TaxID=3155469 RepID=UPI0033E599FB
MLPDVTAADAADDVTLLLKDVDHYLAVTDQLSAQAESPRQSQAILRELISAAEGT